MTSHCIIYESYGAKDLRGVACTMYKYIDNVRKPYILIAPTKIG